MDPVELQRATFRILAQSEGTTSDLYLEEVRAFAEILATHLPSLGVTPEDIRNNPLKEYPY